MTDELNEVIVPLQDIQNINFTSISPFCNIGPGGNETDIFFYHPDHLGSTGVVTDNNANVTQGFLYTPFGELMYEHDPAWQNNRVPKYAFNAKELDEENGMYYYSARYYAPPTFISRDPMFEKYPSISPYTYCGNNPLKYVDPTGMTAEDPDDPNKLDPAKFKNIEPGKNYAAIAVFQKNFADDDLNGAIAKNYNAALKAGMPMMIVDDINDFAASMEKLANAGSSTQSYELNSHGTSGVFRIGDTWIDRDTDFKGLKEGLSGKTVFIAACNAANGKRGKELLQNFAEQTSSTVIGSEYVIGSGYNKYRGSHVLSARSNEYYKSSPDRELSKVYDVTIHRRRGIRYNRKPTPNNSIYTIR